MVNIERPSQPATQIGLVMAATWLALANAGTCALPASRPAIEKFIPTFAVCYSDAKAAQSVEETAKFDMRVLSFGRSCCARGERLGTPTTQ